MQSAADLWRENKKEFRSQLTKMQKARLTLYLVLRDWQLGKDPFRRPSSIKQTYEAERSYPDKLGGCSRAALDALALKKPFWNAKESQRFTTHANRIIQAFEDNGLAHAAKILELGSGAGWLSEYMARFGYSVLGTTLDPRTVALAKRRSESLNALKQDLRLNFKTAAMETAHKTLETEGPFQGIVIYEALHHAFDWEKAIRSAWELLAVNGVLVIANEPNRVHTIKSLRIAKLTKSHEVGLCRRKLIESLKKRGFSKVKVDHAFLLGIRPIWIVAKK